MMTFTNSNYQEELKFADIHVRMDWSDGDPDTVELAALIRKIWDKVMQRSVVAEIDLSR